MAEALQADPELASAARTVIEVFPGTEVVEFASNQKPETEHDPKKAPETDEVTRLFQQAQVDTQTKDGPPADLRIRGIRDVAAEVDLAPPVKFLLKPLWASDAYGAIAGADKSGKTFTIADVGVSVASGTPWLGHFDTETPGPVLMFLGEGGPRKLIRRLRAICAGRDIVLEDLPLRVCFRVPHLSKKEHLAQIARELELQPAVLTIVDPLYLAAHGAKGSDLYEMGAHLEAIQHVTQDAGSALMLTPHFKKGEDVGIRRMSGVGPSAWGRVLGTVDVKHRQTDSETMATTVAAVLAFTGDEIAEMEFRLRRKVWADDPDDLSSALHYEVEVIPAELPADGEFASHPPAVQRVANVLRVEGGPLSTSEIGDQLAEEGAPLKKRTIQDAVKRLRADGIVEESGPYRFVMRSFDGNGS